MNKYQKALNNLKEPTEEWLDKKLQLAENFDEPIVYKHQQDLDLLQQFLDNPPLKFEDLHEGMWIWDDKTKSYIYIFKPLDWKPVKGIRYASHIITNSVEGYYMDFEESRFYHREVSQEGQENE